MSNFSDRLKELMIESNLNQLSLSRLSGVRNTNISDFLAEIHVPSYNNLIKLVYAFDCSADYLLGLVETPPMEQLHPIEPFGDRFRRIIRDLGVSQEQLKRGLSVSGSVLYKWLKGISLPSTEYLVKLSNYLDVSVDHLIGRRR